MNHYKAGQARTLSAFSGKRLSRARRKQVRLTPLAYALAVGLLAGGALTTTNAHAQARPLSSGWFAAKGAAQAQAAATGRLPNGVLAGLNSAARQQQQARQTLNRSVNNLGSAAAAIAAQQAAQKAARASAQNASSVPDGLAQGGLKVDANPLTAGWLNAKAPVQTQGDGGTMVAIEQTADKAILNWETFNVGKNTTVDFQQNKNWAVLNRVNDPQARPSQIQGQIKADGTVMITNANGVVFSGTSQVNVRNLVAAAAHITDEQFQSNGLYGANANTASFTDAGGDAIVEAGARITTHEPESVTQSGGYVLLMGHEAHNAGDIATHKGQTTLAAGDDFIIRRGLSTTGNQTATTQGSEIAPQFGVDSTAGSVSNTGLILSREGDITLAGRDVRQAGVVVATTTVNQRGTVHLLNSVGDVAGRVVLGEGATTAVLIDDDEQQALDSQRSALVEESARQDNNRLSDDPGMFDNYSRLTDRRDQSRIEIVSGGGVVFERDSLTLSTGGQIVADGRGRVHAASGSQLDVSGAVGVRVAMESNNIEVNIQGNEQRDAPINRDSGTLNNSNVWIDRRNLIHMPAGTGGYETERWYTGGGLLEVGGYLDNQGHGIGEWAAQGGTVLLSGPQVLTQPDSMVNLSGGTLDVQAGYIRHTWLRGLDGRLYDVSSAPAGVLYEGIYRGYERASERWDHTDTWRNPLIGPSRRWEPGYTVGRDAGQFIVSAPTAVLDGDIDAKVFNGARQTRPRVALDDGYLQAQTAVARAGRLALGRYGVQANEPGQYDVDVRVGDYGGVAAGLGAGDALPEDLLDTAWLDAARLNDAGLGGLTLKTQGAILIEDSLVLADGGALQMTAADIDIGADVTARGGLIVATNVAAGGDGQGMGGVLLDDDGQSRIVLRGGAALDVRGVWVNAWRDADTDRSRLAYVDGGDVTLANTHFVALEPGSLIDASSGAGLLADGGLAGGRGGDVILRTNVRGGNGTPVNEAALVLDGEIRGYGVEGGGTLAIESGGAVTIGGEVFETNGLLVAGETVPVGITLAEDVLIAAGKALNFDYTVIRDRVGPGEAIGDARLSMNASNTVTTAAEWTLPMPPTGIFQVRVMRPGDTNWQFVRNQAGQPPADPLPAGTVIQTIATNAPGFLAAFIVPGEVFPDGLPIAQQRITYAAGEPLPVDLRIAAGTNLPDQVRFDRDVRVKPTLAIDPAIVRSGFSHYEINGNQGLIVADGTRIDVEMPVYRAGAGTVMRTIASGSDPALALERWTPPLYMMDDMAGSVTQRQGASLVLAASRSESSGTAGPVTIGTGADIRVDPGQSIAIHGSAQGIDVDGRLTAQGGAIDIVNTMGGGSDVHRRILRIGEHAVLDVSGDATTSVDLRGRRYGIVRNGGDITLGSKDYRFASSLYEVSGLPVVVEGGARLDLSGTAAMLDVYASEPAIEVAGDGGTLALVSSNRIVLDGTVDARGGGSQAFGGTLDILLESTFLSGDTPVEDQALRVVTIGARDRAGAGPAGELGQMYLSVDQIERAGFDGLSVYARDAIRFAGDVDLSLGREIVLRQGVLSLTDDAVDSRVRLAAPYIRFDGRTATPAPSSNNQLFQGIEIGTGTTGSALTGADSRFFAEAGLIDIAGGPMLFGAGTRRTIYRMQSQPTQYEDIDLPGFSSIELASRGDIRFDDGGIVAERELIFTADRLYPTTHKAGLIRVGVGPNGMNGEPNEGAVLRLRRPGAGAVEAPHSLFGRLIVNAPIIEQGGAVLAPLGSIEFSDDADTRGTPFSASTPNYLRNHDRAELSLLPGSITSVSAAGVELPYGHTIDGIDYLYDGEKVRYDYVGGLNTDQNDRTSGGIVFKATRFTAEDGAVIDVSGGGVLRGVGFRPGRGGSVDILNTALGDGNPYNGSSAGHEVYAIVPGYAGGHAPVDPTLESPAIGRQITIGEGVPGLAAGTYTLLPAQYALMHGGYRVELGASMQRGAGPRTAWKDVNGVMRTTARVGTVNTGVAGAVPRAITLMSADAVRRHADYNETTLTEWTVSQMARYGTPRVAMSFLPADVRPIGFDFSAVPDLSREVFVFDGALRNRAAEGGYGGTIAFSGTGYEIVGAGGAASGTRVMLRDTELNALGATVLGIGVQPMNSAGGLWPSGSVVMRAGSRLAAGTVILSGSGAGAVTLEESAAIDTRGRGTVGWSAVQGVTLMPQANQAMLVVSNDILAFGPSEGTGEVKVADGASLQGDGTVAILAPGGMELGEIGLSARDLFLSVEDVNIGNEAALAAADRAGVLSSGWRLTQPVLDRLLRPAAGDGLQNLLLQATNSVNFIGDVSLDTFDPASGESSATMSFITPAIYGLGNANDTAVLRTSRFVWSGLSYKGGTISRPVYTLAEPGPVIADGAGTGSGTFRVDADEILFGFAAELDQGANLNMDRLLLGFTDAEFTAGRIAAERKGSLAVYQRQNQATGAYSGGNLTFTTPVLTGLSRSEMEYIAGGALRVQRPAGAAAADVSALDLGGQLRLKADRVILAGTVAAPSGLVEVHADKELILANGALLDLSGQPVRFFEQTRHSFGGSVVLESATGDIVQEAGSVIDVSGAHSDGGAVRAVAVAGDVRLVGTLQGAGGEGGRGGSVDVRAGRIVDFIELNRRLSAGGFDYLRRFETHVGDVVVGSEVRAQHIAVTANGGDLIVDGYVRGGGRHAGSIRLAARDDLMLRAGAVLDASGDELRRDSDGGIIEGVNRAIIDLTSRDGRVVLGSGATLDVGAGGQALGTVDINARRIGGVRGNDVAVDAAAPLTVSGAKRVAVNGIWRYDDARVDPEDSGTQIVDQAYLDTLHGDSTAFIDAALGNAALANRIVGLRDAAGAAFQLRPGVDIVSADADGNLRVEGDLDLAGYRYGPDANPAQRGSGVAGVFSLRAGGDLTVNGSITDGFDQPPVTPDDAYELAVTGRLSGPYTLPHDMVLDAGWNLGSAYFYSDYTLPFDLNPTSQFMVSSGSNYPTITLPMDLALNRVTNIRNMVLDGGASLAAGVTVTDTATGISYTGEIPAGTNIGQASLPIGTVMKAGNQISGTFYFQPTTIPAGTPMVGMRVNAAAEFSQQMTLPGGTTLPQDFRVSTLASAAPVEQKIWAMAPMLAAGSQSWSMQLVGGADLASADTRTARRDERGDLVLSNLHFVMTDDATAQEGVSVLRTGTGDLDLIAGRDYRQESRFGVYTAGTYVDNADTRAGGALNLPRATLADGSVLGGSYSDYEAAIAGYRPWFTTGGGNLAIEAGRDVLGHMNAQQVGRQNYGNLEVGDWLWNQGAAQLGQQSAWWINFGSYALRRTTNGSLQTRDGSRYLAAFDGVGTLGGGNVILRAGRDMGAYESVTALGERGALMVAVGSSGWVDADGTVHRTGGGDLAVDVGRQINPVATGPEKILTGFVNLRGDIDVGAGSVGTVWQTYTPTSTDSTRDPRPDTYSRHVNVNRYGPASVLPGDGTVNLRSRGDLVMELRDPGLQGSAGVVGAQIGGERGAVLSWFTQFSGQTAVQAMSAGGDLLIGGEAPARTSAIAANGNLYGDARFGNVDATLEVRPTDKDDELAFLASDSIYYLNVNTSGAPTRILATPANPAWQALPVTQIYNEATVLGSNLAGYSGYGDVYARGQNSLEHGSVKISPALLYARDGDIVYVEYGQSVRDNDGAHSYISGRPAFVRAGRDIVSFGEPGLYRANTDEFQQKSSLFGHHATDDVSLIQAGRDLIYISAMVAGPGTLELIAGRNLSQDDNGTLRSVGLVGAAAGADPTGGADIAITVGAGSEGLDFSAVRQAYLDSVNLADADAALADQPGKVAKVYGAELSEWLGERYGFDGDSQDALVYFDGLAPEQQRIFLRNVYYAELLAGGREYNDADGPRSGSYLRGRRMIETLLPGADSEAGTSPYQGDLVMFSTGNRSGLIRTEGGGDIQILVPGGDVIVGVDAVRPENAHNGILTQGAGNVQIYSQGDIALGLSRIFTTFGGDIFGWSAAGDINAGRGAKTSVVYTPPRRLYDDMGNLTLSPAVPSSGAGIATLASVAEVPPGNVDLIAPLGVIDAGEAGIRVSGDVNLAALQVVNADNIQVQGESVGMPVVVAVNVGALTSASAASSAAADAAQDSVSRARNEARQNQPSIFSVRILGFGGDPVSGGGASPTAQSVSYKPNGVVQVEGAVDM